MTKTVIAVIVWSVAIAAGMGTLVRYEREPGPAGGRKVENPASSAWRLVMFCHPKCPCTGASISELERILDRAGESVSCEVWFFRPAEESDEWAHSTTWARAARLARTRVMTDPDGAEASRRGALTSGHVFLLDEHGNVVFSGGVTGARGRSGENTGEIAVLSLIESGRGQASAPVYGCPIGASAAVQEAVAAEVGP